MKAAFGQPGFTRLYAGLTVSMFGDSIMLLVLGIWVKVLTGSNALAGLTFFFMVIPALFAPLIGIVLDRLKRKPVLVWGSVASALGVLPLVAVRDAGDVWIVWAVAFCYGISFIVLPAALNGLLKELVPDHLLVEANSSVQTTKEAFRLVGPLVGAALFAWLGGWVVAVLDAATFAAAAVVISGIPVREEEPAPEQSHFWHQLTAGMRHLVEDRILRQVLVGFGLAMLVLGFSESAVFALTDALHQPATFVSVFVTAQGVGAIAGGLLTPRLVRRVGEVAGTSIALGLVAVSIGAIALTHQVVLVLALAAVLGFAIPILTIAFYTLLQRRSPQALMGRVSTAVEVVMGLPQAASLAVGSLLVAVLDYRVIFAIIGVVIAAGAIYVAATLRDQLGHQVAPIEGGAADADDVPSPA